MKREFKFPCTKMTIVIEIDKCNGEPRLMVTEPLNAGMVIDSLDGPDLINLNNYLTKILNHRAKKKH